MNWFANFGRLNILSREIILEYFTLSICVNNQLINDMNRRGNNWWCQENSEVKFFSLLESSCNQKNELKKLESFSSFDT